MMPNWSFSIHAHILAETMVGIAQGMRMAARTRPRPLNSALSTSATIEAEDRSRAMTEMTVKRTVFQTACHQTGSTSRPSSDRRCRSPASSTVEIVVEADPLARSSRSVERGVGEAEIDRAEQRPAGDGGKHDQHRQQEQPGRADPLARELRSLRDRRCRRRQRRRRMRRGRHVDPPASVAWQVGRRRRPVGRRHGRRCGAGSRQPQAYQAPPFSLVRSTSSCGEVVRGRAVAGQRLVHGGPELARRPRCT